MEPTAGWPAASGGLDPLEVLQDPDITWTTIGGGPGGSGGPSGGSGEVASLLRCCFSFTARFS
jgi:hypothetical protein